MGRTYYNTVDGRMISQTKDSVRTNFHTDALGSVTSTTINAVVANTYRYKPYGEILSRTGAELDPQFLWTGDTGSRANPTSIISNYNRRRHYSSILATWNSVDPLWPKESSYGYAYENPIQWRDPFGNQPVSYPSGKNYGCNSSPCCDYNTKYWKDTCKKTGNRLECCASKVSEALCAAVHLANFVCSIPPCVPFLATIISPRLGLKIILTQGEACILGPSTDCQNSCMRYNHQTKRDPEWGIAAKVCKKFGMTSKKCCEATILAEQNEYTHCAKECFPPLGVLPHDLRVQFGLHILKCCD